MPSLHIFRTPQTMRALGKRRSEVLHTNVGEELVAGAMVKNALIGLRPEVTFVPALPALKLCTNCRTIFGAARSSRPHHIPCPCTPQVSES